MGGNGDDDGNGGNDSGILATRVTDQPGDIDDFESCVVTITAIRLKPAEDDGEGTEDDGTADGTETPEETPTESEGTRPKTRSSTRSTTSRPTSWNCRTATRNSSTNATSRPASTST
jgi:hypothetical protein